MDEWAIAIYVTITTMGVLIGLTLARQSSTVFGLFAFLAVAFVHQQSLGAVGFFGDLGTHAVPGLALVVMARHTLTSETGLPTLDWKVPIGLIGPVLFLTIVIERVAEAFEGHSRGVKQVGHDVIHLCTISLALSTGSESLAARRGATRDTIGTIRVARAVHDPLMVAAIGLVLLGHEHDTQGIAVAFHHTMAYLLMTLAAASVGCSAAHLSGAATTGRACQFARALHALAYLLTGCWLTFMAIYLYTFKGRRGLHHLLDARESFGHPGAWEETTIILAAQTWACTCVVVFWHIRERRRAAQPVTVEAAVEVGAKGAWPKHKPKPKPAGGRTSGEEVGTLLGREDHHATNGYGA